MGRATLQGRDGEFWVCQYGPAGNVDGQFSEKVKPPVKTADECKDTDTAARADGGDFIVSSGGGFSDRSLPSACTPNSPLPTGSLCVYGYQCASKFCCPRLKVCLVDAKTGISTSDIKVKDPEKRKDIVSAITSGGTCKDYKTNFESCVQDQDGQPLDTWDQSVCGCTDLYTWSTTRPGRGSPSTTSLASSVAAAAAAAATRSPTATLWERRYKL